MRALGSTTDKKNSHGSDTSSFSGIDSSSSTTESTDVSLDTLDPSSSFTSTSDDASTGSPASLNISEDTTEDDGLTTLLLEQQMAWEDATTDTPDDVQIESSLEPAVQLDQQMICDIQKIAGRLAAKANQLISK